MPLQQVLTRRQLNSFGARCADIHERAEKLLVQAQEAVHFGGVNEASTQVLLFRDGVQLSAQVEKQHNCLIALELDGDRFVESVFIGHNTPPVPASAVERTPTVLNCL